MACGSRRKPEIIINLTIFYGNQAVTFLLFTVALSAMQITAPFLHIYGVKSYRSSAVFCCIKPLTMIMYQTSTFVFVTDSSWDFKISNAFVFLSNHKTVKVFFADPNQYGFLRHDQEGRQPQFHRATTRLVVPRDCCSQTNCQAFLHS